MKFDLNTIVEYYNGLNEQARYAVLAGVVVLILVVDALALAWPQIGAISNNGTQISKLSGDIQEVLTDRQRVNQLKRNLEQQRGQMDALSQRVRQVQEVAVVLTTISSVANEFGVKIDQMVPQKGQQETLTKTGDKYYALPVEIKAHGGYHNFGRFLNKLENGDLSFIMKDFIIQNDTDTTSMHSFDLTVKLILVDKH